MVIAVVRLAILFTKNLKDITCESSNYRCGRTGLPTYLCTPDSTSICTWTLVEPAVEVLSGCLPTMAPLLKLRIHPRAYISPIFRLPFFSSTSNDKRARRGPHSREPNHPKLWPYNDTIIVSNVSAAPRHNGSEDSDLVPLQAIMVRQDVEWKETQRRDRDLQV